MCKLNYYFMLWWLIAAVSAVNASLLAAEGGLCTPCTTTDSPPYPESASYSTLDPDSGRPVITRTFSSLHVCINARSADYYCTIDEL